MAYCENCKKAVLNWASEIEEEKKGYCDKCDKWALRYPLTDEEKSIVAREIVTNCTVAIEWCEGCTDHDKEHSVLKCKECTTQLYHMWSQLRDIYSTNYELWTCPDNDQL